MAAVAEWAAAKAATKPTVPSSGRQSVHGGKAAPGRGGKAAVAATSKNSRVVIEAAFPNDKSAMATYLPKLMDNFAVNAAPVDSRAASTSTRRPARC